MADTVPVSADPIVAALQAEVAALKAQSQKWVDEEQHALKAQLHQDVQHIKAALAKFEQSKTGHLVTHAAAFLAGGGFVIWAFHLFGKL